MSDGVKMTFEKDGKKISLFDLSPQELQQFQGQINLALYKQVLGDQKKGVQIMAYVPSIGQKQKDG